MANDSLESPLEGLIPGPTMDQMTSEQLSLHVERIRKKREGSVAYRNKDKEEIDKFEQFNFDN